MRERRRASGLDLRRGSGQRLGRGLGRSLGRDSGQELTLASELASVRGLVDRTDAE